MFSGFMVNAWDGRERSSPSSPAWSASSPCCAARRSSRTRSPTARSPAPPGASLIGVNTLIGLGVFSLLGALGIGLLGRRGRHDVATALALVMMLGLGALFLSFSVEYAPEVYSLLFGEVLGISSNQVAPTAALALVCVAAIALLYRPLMLSSVLAGGRRGARRQQLRDGAVLPAGRRAREHDDGAGRRARC